MKYIIQRGKHRAFPPHFRILKAGSYSVTASVIIGGSFLEWNDNGDTSKLFGLSFKLLPFKKKGKKDKWVPGHHYSSVRFGIRPSSFHKGLIEVSMYAYSECDRTIESICHIEPSREYKFILDVNNINGEYAITLVVERSNNDPRTMSSKLIDGMGDSVHFGIANTRIKKKEGNKLFYPLNPHYGGDEPSKNRIEIDLKRKYHGQDDYPKIKNQ